MLIQILLLIASLTGILFGANWLIDGASGIARKAHVSEFVIGLTIVGFGTSCPELVVSTIGALQANADIAIGNVFGSNIFNTAVALGLTAILMPISMTKANKRVDIPVTLFVTFILVAFGLTSQTITRFEGIIFLIMFGIYIYLTFKFSTDDVIQQEVEKITTFKAIILTISGLLVLIGGGQIFVYSAENLGHIFGLSDKFIGLTILAGGTSFPELITCIMATYKGKGQMALGDILGSNVFNILLILGVGATIYPLSFASIKIYDIIALILPIFIIFASSFKKNLKLERFSGILLLLLYAGYFTWLVIRG